jgi:hypothetical protein
VDIVKLGIEVDSRKVKTATKDLDRLDREAKQAEKSAVNLGRAFGALGGALAGGAIFRTVIANTIEQERVTAQLEQTLKSTGRYTPELSKSLQSYAASLQTVTRYGDEAIIGAQALMLTFTQVSGDIFPRATEAALDVATAMGTDLKSAVIQVGKALNDPKRGLDALSRSGIQFSETQKDLIKSLLDTNRKAEAQEVILKELERQFGGSARAARDTLGGALDSLGNAFGDLLEGDAEGDGVRGATQAINDLTDVMSSSETKQAFGNITTAVFTLAKGATSAAVEFSNLGTQIGANLAAISGQLTPLDELEQQIKDVERALKGGFSTPIKYLFTSEEELEKLKADLINQRDALLSAAGVLKDSKADLPDVPEVLGGDDEEQSKAVKKAIENARKSLQGLASDMQMQASTFGQSDAAVLKYRLTLGDLSEQVRALGPEGERLAQSIVRQAEALEKAKIAEEVEKSFRDLTASLEEQSEAIGMTERELYIYEATTRLSANATDDMRDSVRQLAGALYDEKQALEAAQQQRQRANEITQEVMTPLEQYQAAISELNDLMLNTDMSHETFARAANKAWKDTVGKAKESTDEITEFTKQAAKNMQDAMADGFFDIMQGEFGNLEDSFKRTIDRMVSNILASQLNNWLLGDAAKTGEFGGVAGKIFSSLLSFDGGGNTGTGPRTGGVDGKGGFPAVLHPNETVIDHTKGQSAGGVVVSINVNGVRDEGGLKRTAAQIAQQSGIAAQRAMARNG